MSGIVGIEKSGRLIVEHAGRFHVNKAHRFVIEISKSGMVPKIFDRQRKVWGR